MEYSSSCRIWVESLATVGTKREEWRYVPISDLAVLMMAAVATGISGCGRGSKKNIKIDGVDGPFVNFVDGKFTLSVVSVVSKSIKAFEP